MLRAVVDHWCACFGSQTFLDTQKSCTQIIYSFSYV